MLVYTYSNTKGNDMRSYTVYGIKNGGAEQYITTVHSADEGKAAHSKMKSQGYWDTMIVRNCLGGHVMRKEFKGANDEQHEDHVRAG